MADSFTEALTAALQKRADDTDLPRMPRRTPSQNNPLAPEYRRPERRTRPTYSDPTGNEAIGNIKKERKR